MGQAAAVQHCATSNELAYILLIIIRSHVGGGDLSIYRYIAYTLTCPSEELYRICTSTGPTQETCPKMMQNPWLPPPAM